MNLNNCLMMLVLFILYTLKKIDALFSSHQKASRHRWHYHSLAKKITFGLWLRNTPFDKVKYFHFQRVRGNDTTSVLGFFSPHSSMLDRCEMFYGLITDIVRLPSVSSESWKNIYIYMLRSCIWLVSWCEFMCWNKFSCGCGES